MEEGFSGRCGPSSTLQNNTTHPHPVDQRTRVEAVITPSRLCDLSPAGMPTNITMKVASLLGRHPASLGLVRSVAQVRVAVRYGNAEPSDFVWARLAPARPWSRRMSVAS